MTAPGKPLERGASLRAWHLLAIGAAVAIAALGACKDNDRAGGSNDPNYLPPPPMAPGLPIPVSAIPKEPPLWGPEGRDRWGVPHKSPDLPVLMSLLRTKRFNDLERYVTYYQTQFESDPRLEDWPNGAFHAFHHAVPEFGPLLDTWVETMPQSWAARMARGHYYTALGWHYRGEKYVFETSDAQMSKLETYLGKARQEFEAALKLKPDIYGARVSLLRIAITRGTAAKRERLLHDQAVKLCPTCLGARGTFLRGLQPRWGGSFEEMTAYVESFRPLMTKNKKLSIYTTSVDLERSRTLWEKGHKDKALTLALEAAQRVPTAMANNHIAKLYLWKRNYEQALKHANQAIAILPTAVTGYTRRMHALEGLGDIVAAATDLDLVRRNDPADPDLDKRASRYIKWLRYHAHQDFEAKRYDEAGSKLATALRLAPDDTDIRRRLAFNDRELGLDKLLKAAHKRPDDFYLRLRIDGAYIAAGRQFDKIVAMWTAYLQRHPQDARAWAERSGANFHLGDKKAARSDIEKACGMAYEPACQTIRRHFHHR